MSAIILNGTETAAGIRREIEREVAELKPAAGAAPGLAVLLIGDDPASSIYVKMKEKACARVGIASFPHRLPGTARREELLELIDRLNRDPEVSGILVQLPLPPSLDEREIVSRLDPEKDVDGFHPHNLGRLVRGEALFVPCTPAGIRELLRRYRIPTEGRDAVIVGRSNIVGKPLAVLLAAKNKDGNATVTVCHTRTRDLAAHTRRADILVAAAGVKEMISADMVKPGAAVIDVGIHAVGRRPDGKRILAGDVDFKEAKNTAGAITPVPGGVGPMTIAMLLKNTLTAFKRQRKPGQRQTAG